MDRLLKEERRYVLKLCKAIAATGANVLLVQKSILRDATSELGVSFQCYSPFVSYHPFAALHFLAKMKIMVVSDVERSDIEFICKNLGCTPIASVEGLSSSKLGAGVSFLLTDRCFSSHHLQAARVEEESTPGGAIVRVTGTGGVQTEQVKAAIVVGKDDKDSGAAKKNSEQDDEAAMAVDNASKKRAGAVCVLVRGSNPLVVRFLRCSTCHHI